MTDGREIRVDRIRPAWGKAEFALGRFTASSPRSVGSPSSLVSVRPACSP